MSEMHLIEFDYFSLRVEVNDEGDVSLIFDAAGDRPDQIRMDWDTFREVIDFTAVHGLKMKTPYVVEYADTAEAREEAMRS